jgi:hypothetical protein
MKNPRNQRWVEPPANPPEMEWVRLAAFIDGEGSIQIRARGNNVISVVLCNTDPRLLVWAKDTFKVGTISTRTFKNWGEKTKFKHKPGYAWEVQARAAQWLLEGCFPFFILKKEQAQICLEVRSTVKSFRGRAPLTLDILSLRAGLKEKLSSEKKRIIPMEEISHVS